MAKDNRAWIYGYFATKDFSYDTINIKKDDCFYIGIATTTVEERHSNHMKPSKKHVQVINTVLQENPDCWDLEDDLGKAELDIDMMIDLDKDLIEEIKTKFEKEFIHMLEMKLVNKFNPSLNVYGKGE